MGVLPAGVARLLIGRTGNYGAVAARIGIFPRDGCAGLAAFESLHLRRVGAALVFVVHRRTDAIADQAPDRGAGDAGREPRSRVAAELGSDEGAGDGAHSSAGILLRALAGLRSCRTSREAARNQQ